MCAQKLGGSGGGDGIAAHREQTCQTVKVSTFETEILCSMGVEVSCCRGLRSWVEIGIQISVVLAESDRHSGTHLLRVIPAVQSPMAKLASPFQVL